MSFAQNLSNIIQSRRASGGHYGATPVYNLSVNEAEWVQAVAAKYGFPAEWLANLINFESGGTFNPAIQNSIGATGLIQFMPTTAPGLGTTTAKLKQMSFKEQMVYVDKYLKKQLEAAAAPKGLYNKTTGKVTDKFTQTDLFMLIFYPVSVGNVNYRFPANVVAANNGIATPKDYTNRVLVASSTPYKSISPYLGYALTESIAFGQRNKTALMLTALGFAGVIVGVSIYLAKK